MASCSSGGGRGPRTQTQRKQLVAIVAKNSASKQRKIQRKLIKWVMENGEKAMTVWDLIENEQIDLMHAGEVVDPKKDKPVIKR
eukprot:4800329-Lingulodinium_polyedra.AAC.1